MPQKTKILIVCLGNICRSPMAEGMVRLVAAQRDLIDHLFIDSAGTGNWHVGSPPDSRAIRAAAKRGSDISSLRARQITTEDFFDFDHILAMDDQNLETIRQMAPKNATASINLFMAFSITPDQSVPDPYYGADGGFDHALDLIESGAAAMLSSLLENQVASS